MVHEFSEKEIVKGSGYISAQCCGSTEIELGTVYTAEMGIILFSEIERYILEDALVELYYHLLVGEAYETVPMGIYEISEANRTIRCLRLRHMIICFGLKRILIQQIRWGMSMKLSCSVVRLAVWSLHIPRQRLSPCRMARKCFPFTQKMILKPIGTCCFISVRCLEVSFVSIMKGNWNFVNMEMSQ